MISFNAYRNLFQKLFDCISYFMLLECNFRNMWNVWRTVLEENEKLARARLAAVEVFSQHVADDAKILRNHKIISAKKVK
jgi:hypothetical protein